MGENVVGVRFRCFVHHPLINEDGTEAPNLVRGSGIDLAPNILLSSIAADVLSDMFQKGEIEGKIILKADNAKGNWVVLIYVIQKKSQLFGIAKGFCVKPLKFLKNFAINFNFYK